MLLALFAACVFLREVCVSHLPRLRRPLVIYLSWPIFEAINLGLMVQAGFQERAIAAFQSVIEYSLSAPAQFPATRRAASHVGLFEAYFGSEVPRFGEPGLASYVLTD